MEEITIKKQRQMTLAETLDFCISSIRHRFMRSLLTLSVVILAVAFFMFLQCSNIFKNSVKDGVEKEILESRKASRILNMLYAPTTEADFLKMLVTTKQSPSDFNRLAKVLGLSSSEMQRFVDMASKEMIYLTFFDDLTIGKRKALFDQRKGAERLELLLDEKEYAIAETKMRELGGIRLPGGNTDFKTFLSTYAEYRVLLKKSFAKWLALQKQLPERDKLKDTRILASYLLALNKEGKINEWRDMLKSLNFELSDQELKDIISYLDITDRMEKIKTLLYDAAYRVRWRQVYGRNQYSRMEEKLEILNTDKAWRVFNEAPSDENLAVLKKKQIEIFGAEVTRTDLDMITEEFLKRKDLSELELQLDIDTVKISEGFSASQIYLMCLSFLVCVVGITNAMLMSITERFREIATLKCLGATDSFILVQIVLEALIQGLIGGFVGLFLGFLVALFSSVFQVGTRVFASFDWSMIGYAALFSLLSGVLLSVLSSLYPSTKAARMAPMEAMRVE